MSKKRIHKDHSTDTRPKTRNRVESNCTLHCNGSKWVNPRTFERHQQEIERFRTITSVPQSSAGNGTGQCPWTGRPGLSRSWT